MYILVTRSTLQPKVALHKVVPSAPHRVGAVKEDDDPLVVHLFPDSEMAPCMSVAICVRVHPCLSGEMAPCIFM